MQPTGTGALHLGNLDGALRSWVSLQDEYEMFCFIADWHALTTRYEETEQIAPACRQVAADYIAALRARRQLQVEMAAVFQNIDCYVTVPFAGPSLVYTNLTGHPTIVTRCGLIEGVPQSIEFVGGLYRESAILRLAFAYEQATAWHQQWPDMTKVSATETKV